MDLSMIAPPELEELTTCSFCHFPFNDTDAVPKLFTCRHYFCLKCVNLLLRENSDEIVCVNCWKRTTLQGPEPKSENLPNHNGILYLIQNFNTLNVSGNGNGSGNSNNNSKTLNKNANGNNANQRNEEQQQQQQRLMRGNETNLLAKNFNQLNGGDISSSATSLMANNFSGGCGVGGLSGGENGASIIDMNDKERSPSIASSSGGSIASSINLSNCGGGMTMGYNGNCNNSNSNINTNNNNYINSSNSTTHNTNTNAEHLKMLGGENCMTHAMPNTLWCSTCSIQLCRACAGNEEHRMHPVRNQIEAKESLHNDISHELQSMHKTLNDVQQLLVKQRDFLVKILESCTTLKSQIESELINPLPTVEIGEMRESLMKAGLCLELLDKQTPGDALKLYTTLHSEKQRLVAKYQEMFLQCKLDELIKNCAYVFDFDLIKQALIQFHSSAVSSSGNGGNSLEALLGGYDETGGGGGGNIGGISSGINNLNGLANQQQQQQNPVLLLANYCISQLYSRHMLVLKQQQQQHQQQQHQQGINIGNQQQQQQSLNFNNNFNQQEYETTAQAHQQPHQQQFQNQPSLLPNGFLNSLISNISSAHTHNSVSSNNDNAAQQTTYAQALQQSATSKAQQQQQQQPPIGQQRAETPLSKSYAAIINNANKTNLQNRNQQLHQHQHPHQHQHQPQQQQKSTFGKATTHNNEMAPIMAPIGTRASNSSSTSSSTASSSTTTATAMATAIQRTTAHIFAAKATANSLNLSLLHLQHHNVRTQQQQAANNNNSSSNTATNQNQTSSSTATKSSTQSLLLNPSVHIYPIYYFNIEIEGEHCGRFLIEVRHDVAPKMAKNFNSLVTQEFGFGYKGCQVFQCWDNESIITGDYELNNGRGGRSVFEEAFFLPEDTKILGIRGSVGMRRSQKRHDNMGLVGSQFRIILREMRGFTGIFGFVIDGLELIERISKVGDPTGRPQSMVIISNCGKYQ